MLGKVAAKGADHPPHLLRDLPLGGDGVDLHGRHPKAWQQGEQAALGAVVAAEAGDAVAAGEILKSFFRMRRQG